MPPCRTRSRILKSRREPFRLPATISRRKGDQSMTHSVWKREVGRVLAGVWLSGIALGIGSASHAQEGATVRREIRAVRLSPPPVIDGDLSDACWQQAARADRFTDVLYSSPVA